MLALLVLNGLLVLWLALRRPHAAAGLAVEQGQAELLAALQMTAKNNTERLERLER